MQIEKFSNGVFVTVIILERKSQGKNALRILQSIYILFAITINVYINSRFNRHNFPFFSLEIWLTLTKRINYSDWLQFYSSKLHQMTSQDRLVTKPSIMWLVKCINSVWLNESPRKTEFFLYNSRSYGVWSLRILSTVLYSRWKSELKWHNNDMCTMHWALKPDKQDRIRIILNGRNKSHIMVFANFYPAQNHWQTRSKNVSPWLWFLTLN